MWKHVQKKPWETISSWELSSRECVSWCLISTRDTRDDTWKIGISMPRSNIPKNGHLPEREGWALCGRVSELLLRLKDGWCRLKWNWYAKVQRPRKPETSWEEGLSFLQRMHELRLSHHKRWRRSSILDSKGPCSVSRRDDAENRKEDCRKEKYKHLFWCNVNNI